MRVPALTPASSVNVWAVRALAGGPGTYPGGRSGPVVALSPGWREPWGSECADHRPGRPATQNEAHLSSSWVISARQGGHSPPRVSMAIAGERGHRDQRFWW